MADPQVTDVQAREVPRNENQSHEAQQRADKKMLVAAGAVLTVMVFLLLRGYANSQSENEYYRYAQTSAGIAEKAYNRASDSEINQQKCLKELRKLAENGVSVNPEKSCSSPYPQQSHVGNVQDSHGERVSQHVQQIDIQAKKLYCNLDTDWNVPLWRERFPSISIVQGNRLIINNIMCTSFVTNALVKKLEATPGSQYTFVVDANGTLEECGVVHASPHLDRDCLSLIARNRGKKIFYQGHNASLILQF